MAFSANGMAIIASWNIGKGRKQEDKGNEKKIIKNRKGGEKRNRKRKKKKKRKKNKKEKKWKKNKKKEALEY